MGYYDNYLEHHGILGQKWGVRRFEKKGGGLTTAGKMRYGEKSDLYNAKNAKNTKVSKASGNYYGNSNFVRTSNGMKVGAPNTKGIENLRKIEGSKVGGAVIGGLAKVAGADKNKVDKEIEAVRESNKLHKQAVKDSKAEFKAEKKEAKKAYKEEYKKNLKEVRENASFGDKLTYNDATRRRAAKIMTKYNNISMEEANKQAKKEAWRNTAIIVGAYAGISVAAIAMNKNR